MLVWHLYQAARAGRDIYYDQRYPPQPGDARHPRGDRHSRVRALPALVVAELTRYTKLFWINTGPYNNLTARKFVLNLSREQLVEAAEIAARDGARFRLEPAVSHSASSSRATRRCSSIRRSIPWSRARRPATGATSWRRARTTSTTASRWRTSTGSRSAIRSTRASSSATAHRRRGLSRRRPL